MTSRTKDNLLMGFLAMLILIGYLWNCYLLRENLRLEIELKNAPRVVVYESLKEWRMKRDGGVKRDG